MTWCDTELNGPGSVVVETGAVGGPTAGVGGALGKSLLDPSVAADDPQAVSAIPRTASAATRTTRPRYVLHTTTP